MARQQKKAEVAAEVYLKLRSGDSIGDDELFSAICTIGSMLTFFKHHRSVFELTFRELQRSHDQLTSFQESRKRNATTT